MATVARIAQFIDYNRPKIANVARVLSFEESVPKLNRIHSFKTLKEAEELCDKTPDGAWLEDSLYQPVFLYCPLVRGGAQHSVIEKLYCAKDDSGQSLNPYAYTAERFEMYQTNGGRASSPVIIPSTKPPIDFLFPGSLKQPRTAQVKGRVYYIPSNQMKVLDDLKGNGVLFHRKRVEILVPYRLQIKDKIEGHETYTTGCVMTPEKIERGYVWAYVGKQDMWYDLINEYGFSTVEHLPFTRTRVRNGQIYSVTKPWATDSFYYFFNAWRIANK